MVQFPQSFTCEFALSPARPVQGNDDKAQLAPCHAVASCHWLPVAVVVGFQLSSFAEAEDPAFVSLCCHPIEFPEK
jgi:hypothetical protein